jgi:phosphate uptake regulator
MGGKYMEDKLCPRNLVKLGSNSLVVSLPKEWLKKNNLSKGDILYLKQEKNNIILSNNNRPQTEIKEITIELEKKALARVKSEIITAYKSGYDIIKISGNRIKAESSKIKEIIHDLVGLEIIQQTSKLIVSKELLDLEKTSLSNITHRIDYIVRGMLDDLVTVETKEDAIHIYERDYDVNRLTYLIFRTINKAFEHPSIMYSLKRTYNQLMHIKLVVFNLESIGDAAKRIAKIKYSNKKDDEVVALIKFSFRYFLHLEILDSFSIPSL